MKTTKEEILKGCEHDGSYIPVSEVKRLMQEYAEAYHKEKLKEEILQKIIEKQKELIEDLLIGYLTPTTKTAKRLQVELAALNAQLEQSTNKSTIERKDFFESQMEDETLREELIKLVREARKGSMITSGITDVTYWKFDIDSEIKIVDNYLNSKE